MIAATLLWAAGGSVASAESWVETFKIESITIEGVPIDVERITQRGGPIHLCIPKTDAKDVARWLRNRDSTRCQITTESVRKDRLVLEATCPVETGKSRRKAIDLEIGRHSYAGTYHETGRSDAGEAYRLMGRINAHRVGLCSG
jgi:hypothetical protein